jgi:hypothetical protein
MPRTTSRTVAVGVFEDQSSAQSAVRELKDAGFTEAQIGVVAHNSQTDDAEYAGRAAASSGDSKAAEGAVAGVATGASVGALWALGIAAGLLPAIGPVVAGGILGSILLSAAGGAAVAGLAGALIGLGIPEEEAKYYESEFRGGRTIVTVRADDRYDEAVAILQQNDGFDMKARPAPLAAR